MLHLHVRLFRHHACCAGGGDAGGREGEGSGLRKPHFTIQCHVRSSQFVSSSLLLPHRWRGCKRIRRARRQIAQSASSGCSPSPCRPAATTSKRNESFRFSMRRRSTTRDFAQRLRRLQPMSPPPSSDNIDERVTTSSTRTEHAIDDWAVRLKQLHPLQWHGSISSGCWTRHGVRLQQHCH